MPPVAARMEHGYPTSEGGMVIDIGWTELADLCASAITAAGADEPTTAVLTDAVIAAERRGVRRLSAWRICSTTWMRFAPDA